MSADKLPLNRAELVAKSSSVDPWHPLIGRIANGEQAALDELRIASLSKIYAVAKRILVAAEDAEEIVYDVLLWVWRNPDRYDPNRGTVATWLNNLAWSRSIDLLRKRKRRDDLLHPQADLAAYEGNVKDPDSWLSCFDDRSRVLQALNGLTSTQRQLVLMAFFQGLSHQEIAAQTERPLGTIKSLIRRGLLQMRSTLSEDE